MVFPLWIIALYFYWVIISCYCVNAVKALEEQDQPLNEKDNQHNIRSGLTLDKFKIKLHGVETKSKSCWHENISVWNCKSLAHKPAYNFKRHTLYPKGDTKKCRKL